MREELAKELEKIGLSENEAKVYLAGLESGPSTAQMLAAKATVSRPTTYIMIESLIKRGLMSSFMKGKKNFFKAENPEGLGNLLDNELEKIQKRKQIFSELLPNLSKINTTAGVSPRARVFEDLVGLVQLQEDLIEIASKTKLIYSMAAVDDARNFVSKKSMQPVWKRIQENKIRVKSIYTTSGAPQEHESDLWEGRILPKEKFPFHGELTLYGNKATMITYGDKISAIQVEDESVSGLLKTMFELAWEEATKYS